MKDGMPVEISIKHSASYKEVLKHCIEAVWSGDSTNLRLFTSGGAIIMEDEQWSLQSYMQRVHKGTVKLGVSAVESKVTFHINSSVLPRILWGRPYSKPPICREHITPTPASTGNQYPTWVNACLSLL